eukprot:IDg13456t1
MRKIDYSRSFISIPNVRDWSLMDTIEQISRSGANVNEVAASAGAPSAAFSTFTTKRRKRGECRKFMRGLSTRGAERVEKKGSNFFVLLGLPRASGDPQKAVCLMRLNLYAFPELEPGLEVELDAPEAVLAPPLDGLGSLCGELAIIASMLSIKL